VPVYANLERAQWLLAIRNLHCSHLSLIDLPWKYCIMVLGCGSLHWKLFVTVGNWSLSKLGSLTLPHYGSFTVWRTHCWCFRCLLLQLDVCNFGALVNLKLQEPVSQVHIDTHWYILVIAHVQLLHDSEKIGDDKVTTPRCIQISDWELPQYEIASFLVGSCWKSKKYVRFSSCVFIGY